MAGCEERGGDGGGGEGEADEAPFRVGFLDEEGGGDEQTEDGPCREEGSGMGGGRAVAPAQGEEVEGEWWDEPAVAVVVRVGPVPAHLEDGDEEADEGWQEGEPRADGGWLAGKWHVVEGGCPAWEEGVQTLSGSPWMREKMAVCGAIGALKGCGTESNPPEL